MISKISSNSVYYDVKLKLLTSWKQGQGAKEDVGYPMLAAKVDTIQPKARWREPAMRNLLRER